MDDTNAGNSLNMTSVADLMEGRLLHNLICLFLEQRSKGLEGMLRQGFLLFLIISQGIYVTNNGYWTFPVTAHQSQTQERADHL